MSRSCKECVHHNPDFIDKVCLHCSWPEFAGEPSNFKPKPMTNADRIRAMNDEELADLLAGCDCFYCRIHDFCYADGCRRDCDQAWLDWLRQEADHE